jgi:hypothetical protein
MSDTPEFMTAERIMTGEEYVCYSDYLVLQRERDEARQQERIHYDNFLSMQDERNQWRACAKGLAAAASDMQSGWFYIQEVYGRLSGVGWDRTAQGVEAALAEFERLKEASK